MFFFFQEEAGIGYLVRSGGLEMCIRDRVLVAQAERFPDPHPGLAQQLQQEPVSQAGAPRPPVSFSTPTPPPRHLR